MELYIHDVHTHHILAIINGADNELCEEWAIKLNYDGETHGWSYTDENLIRTEHTERYIELSKPKNSDIN